MKKQLLAIALLIASISNAQTWSQNFTSATPPGLPALWLQNNVDALTTYSALASYSFTTKAWVTRDFSASTSTLVSTHGKVAVSTSYYTPAGIANDWLITPSFTVPANAILNWDALAPDATYPDGYLVKISTTGTTTANFATTLLTVPSENSADWNNRTINLNTYAGQTVRIAFVNNSNDMDLLFLDNVSVLVPVANDLKITSIAPTGQAVWGAVSSNKSITGSVVNNGLSTITTFTAKYSDGVINASSVITGLNLSYGQTAPFTITTPYTISSASAKNLKVWVDATGDVTHTNDTLATSINGYSFLPNHKVVFEEGTGTWCGWCVRGAVYMDSMNNVHPTTTVLIAAHNGDPMTDATYDAGIGTLISGYPTALTDRKINIGDPSDMFVQYGAHINDFGLADLAMTPVYNPTTRLASITVTTKVSSTFPNNTTANDYRLAVVFTENNVTGTTTAYDQHNYYQGGGSGVMTGAGHHFSTEPNPVVAANMKYDFVARTIVGGFTGLANSLPSALVAGTTYTSNAFNYTVPAAYNANNMKVHALLIDAKNNIIYNANTNNLISITTGIASTDAPVNMEFSLYPNPASTSVNIDLNMEASESVLINVYNAFGSLVHSETKTNMPIGANKLALNTESYANGIYNVTLSTKQGFVTKKLTITK